MAKPMSSYPTDGGRYLLLVKTFAFVDYGQPYKVTGCKWIEGWYNQQDDYWQKWQPWEGNYQIRSTEHIEPIAWEHCPPERMENGN